MTHGFIKLDLEQLHSASAKNHRSGGELRFGPVPRRFIKSGRKALAEDADKFGYEGSAFGPSRNQAPALLLKFIWWRAIHFGLQIPSCDCHVTQILVRASANILTIL